MALTKVSGDILDSGISVAGVVTATKFDGPMTGSSGTFTGIVTATGLDLNGNADISGITTFTGVIDANATTQSTSSTTGAATFAGGVGIVKNLNVGGDVSIGGTLTYQDVTNIDSVGLITARAGVNISGGEFKVGTAVTIGTAGVITATSYYGDGSNLTNAGASLANGANNRIITATGANALNGEANLTFDGDKVVVTQSAANIGFEVHSTGSGKGAQTMYHNDHGTTYVGVAGNTSGETHFYNASNTATRFYTNSAERIVIAADGKIGIGVAAPVAPLHIYAATNDNLLFGGNINASDGGAIRSMNSDASAWKAFELLSAETRIGGTNSIRFSTSGTGGSTERLRITSDEKFGFGLTSPQTTIHVSQVDAGFWLGNPLGDGFSSGQVPTLKLYSDCSEKKAYIDVIWGGDNAFDRNITFGGSYLALHSPGASNGAETLRVTGERIGIGEYSNISQRVHIREDSNPQHYMVYLQNRYSGVNSSSLIAMSCGGVDFSDNRYAYIGAKISGSSQNGTTLLFATNPNGGSAVERLRISHNGILCTGNYGTLLDQTAGAIQINGGTSGGRLGFRGTTTSAGGGLGEMHGYWDTNKVASILFHAGSDTSNKDDGEIRMYTSASGPSGAERLRIDSSGRVLIGTTSASTDDADTFCVASSGHTGITIRSGTSSKGKILFSDATSGGGQWDGYVQYEHANQLMRIGIAEAERVRINTITVGSATCGTVGINYTNPEAKALAFSVRNIGQQDSSLPLVYLRRDNNSGGGAGNDEICLQVDMPYTFNSAGDCFGIKSYAVHNTNATHYAGYFVARGSQYNAGGDGAGVYAQITKTDTNGPGYVPAGFFYGKHTYNASSSGYAMGIRIKVQALTKNVGMQIHHENTNSDWTTMIRFCKASETEVGSIKSSNNATQYNTNSDYRLKENAVALSDGITRLKQLKPYRFNFKNDTDKTVDGFFAHEVDLVVPEAVSGTKDATKIEIVTNPSTGKNVLNEDGTPKTQTVIDGQELDYSKLTTLTIAALQEAIAKIETLEAKVAALESA